MAFTLTQIIAAHEAVLKTTAQYDESRERINHILATMLVHQMGTVDRNTLEEGVAALIDQLLSQQST